jgi:hypothetical protein
MTSSRSIISRSKSRWVATFLVGLFVLCAGTAFAGGRKRIVVLDFEGPKGEKFHDDLVKLLKKGNTVVSTEKWNGTAEELDATKFTEKNVKKVARKLKIDGVISGKVEKRRDEYIVQLKLRAGKTGELVGNRVDTKAESAKLDGKASRDIKEELLPAIAELEANHGGGGDDEEDTSTASQDDPPAGDDNKHGGFSSGNDDARGSDAVGEPEEPKLTPKQRKAEEARKKKEEGERKKQEAEEARLAAKKEKEDEARRKKEEEAAAASSAEGSDSSSSEEDSSGGNGKRHGKRGEGEGERTASNEEDNGSAEKDTNTVVVVNPQNYSPGERAIDAVVGMSFTARRLSFTYSSDLATPPSGYKQSVPVAGAIVDATVFPLAFTHKRKDLLRGLGFSFMYDRVLRINSQKRYLDNGMPAVANIKTAEQKYGIGAVLRYPLGKMVIAGKVGYSGQTFSLGQTLPNGGSVDIPSVTYSILEFGGMLRYPVTPKILADVDFSLLAVTSAGDIDSADQYGKSTKFGQQLQLGADYSILKNVFIRAAFRFERIGLAFKGTGKQTTMRDSDPEQDVSGATDMYLGVIGTIGYLY